MNILKYSLLIIVSLLFCGRIQAQSPINSLDWTDMMQDPSANFYDIQAKFNEYWDGKTITKGSGWKPFKRWENFMEPRVYPTGARPNPMAASMAMQQYYQSVSGPKYGYWKPLGPYTWTNGIDGYNPGNGRINVVEIDPSDPNTIYVGSPSGGLWKSTDGGLNWSTPTDSLTALGVSGIAIHPNDPQTIYIATGDGDGGDTYSLGVLKSTDGGTSWQSTDLNWNVTQSRKTYRILINPDHPDTILVAADNGIYRTDDGFASFTKIQGGNTRDMEFHPTNPDIVYACYKKYWKSTDGGVSFTQIYNGLAGDTVVARIALGVSPAAPDMVYALAGASAGLVGIYVSTDAGDTWTEKATSPNILGYSDDGSSGCGQVYYDLAIAVDPNDAGTIYTGGINIWKSTDSAATLRIKSHWHWANFNPYVHADIHYLGFFGNTLYAGADGGIFSTIDGGDSWTDHSAGLAIMQFYRMGGYPANENLIYGGTQDNGSNRMNGSIWTHVRGADGMEAVINYRNPDTVYISSQNGGLKRSIDGGNNFAGIRGDITESGAWVTPYVIHPTDPQILFAGYQDVWKTTNAGNNWTKISDVTSARMQTLAISPLDPDYIYAGTNDSIWRSTDGGTIWTNITLGLPNKSKPYLGINPANPDEVSVVISGYTAGEKIYTTYNGGATWINKSGTLPNLPTNCVVYDSSSTQNAVYVSMDVGVFYKNDTLAAWIPFFQALPNVIIEEMEIHYGSGKIRAATHGRGIWESYLYCNSAPDPVFSVLNTIVCAGDTVSFTSAAGVCPQGYFWSFPGGTPSNSAKQNPMIIYTTAGIYDVTLQVINGLGDTSFSMLNRIEVLSDVAYAGADTSLCAGDSVQIGTNNDPNYTYSWTPATGLSATNISNPIAFPMIPTTYTVNKSHVSVSCTSSDSISINVVPNPPVNAGPDVTILLGDSTRLSATLAFIYSWTPITGLSNPSIRKPMAGPAQTTEYRVEVSYVNMCSSEDEVIVYVDSSVAVPDLGLIPEFELLILPNPNNGNFKLKVQVLQSGTLEMTLLDMLGREQVLFTELVQKGASTHQVDAGRLSEGLYYIQAKLNGQLVAIKKVVFLK